MRIIQVLPSLSFGDAVSNDALAIHDVLLAQGYDARMYTENLDRRLRRGVARRIGAMPRLKPKDILLYHCSTGTKLNFDLPSYGGRQVMIYHNITPPSFLETYSPAAAALASEGYRGVRFLADKMTYCIAVSEYNKQDLRELGYTCPIDVCPIMIPFEDYQKEPSRRVLRRYANDGWTNLLFVGRIAPNKKHEDVMRAFYCYQKRYNPTSRLFFVGNSKGMERYEYDLRTYAIQLGIEDKVIFPGHIKFDEILAYYTLADAFVCMSEHEGFCVPLVESMIFNTPIVAYAASAVPETLGGSGLLLDDKDPAFAAAVIDRVVRDESLRTYVVAKQSERLKAFEHDAVAERFMDCIHRLIEAGEA